MVIKKKEKTLFRLFITSLIIVFICGILFMTYFVVNKQGSSDIRSKAANENSCSKLTTKQKCAMLRSRCKWIECGGSVSPFCARSGDKPKDVCPKGQTNNSYSIGGEGSTGVSVSTTTNSGANCTSGTCGQPTNACLSDVSDCVTTSYSSLRNGMSCLRNSQAMMCCDKSGYPALSEVVGSAPGARPAVPASAGFPQIRQFICCPPDQHGAWIPLPTRQGADSGRVYTLGCIN
jgi:hypothetical protein